jgi:MFS family permease
MVGITLTPTLKPIYLLPTHGVMVGMGGSLVYIPILAAPSQWFEKRRAFVAGLAIAGSGVGGMVLAPVVQILLEKVGFRWTLRLLASGFLIRARLPFRQDSLFTRDTLSVISNMMFFFMSTTIAVYALIDYVPLYFITCKLACPAERVSSCPH